MRFWSRRYFSGSWVEDNAPWDLHARSTLLGKDPVMTHFKPVSGVGMFPKLLSFEFQAFVVYLPLWAHVPALRK
eukprot:3321062-Alexandrium_andersonii.AAC.1